MDCTSPIEQDGNLYEIHHWTSVDSSTVHRFPEGFRIFPDDSINTVLIKIAVLLGKTTIPYAWTRRTPLLFHVVPGTAWSGYHANPWKAKAGDFSSPTLQFKTHNLIGDHHRINVVFFEDIASLKLPMDAYFPKIDTKVPTRTELDKQDQYLYALWNVPLLEHQAIQRKDGPCTYTRAVYQMIPGNGNPRLTLSEIFQGFNTTPQIPFAQWCFDNAHILYKVYKNHTIPESKLALWTSAPKVEEGGFVLYSQVTGDIYARMHVNPKFECIITYHMEARDKVPYSLIHQHVSFLQQHWMKVTTQKYILSEREVAIRTELNVKETEFKSLVSYLSHLLPIFNITKFEKNKADVFYKRSSVYKDVTLADHIQSLRDMDVDDATIIERLIQEHNVKPSDIEMYMQELNTGQADQTAIRLETGMWMQLLMKSNVMKVSLRNAPSHQEARQAIHWLRAAVSEARTKKVVKPAKQATPQRLKLDFAGPSKQKTPSSSSSTSEKVLNQLQSDDLDFLDGGALGNFISPLHNADADIFNKATYSSKCSVTNNRQPVVISPEEYDKYKEIGKDELLDNTIRYGSRPTNENIYFCPRIWCPQSKVPVKPGEDCPAPGEKPLLMYKHNYWGNDPNKPHYVGFHKDVNEKGLCLPCCYTANQAKNEGESGKKKKVGAKKLHYEQCMQHAHVQAPQGDVKAPKKKQAPVTQASSTVKPLSASDVPGENYLMQDVALPVGRNGSIPEVLHEILLPDVKYQICSKQLSSQPCVVRRGIGKPMDPIMTAISYALGKKNKKELILAIEKHLDPLTFMTLEDGMVLSAFLPVEPILPKKQPKMCAKFLEWIAPYDKYIKTFQLEAVLDYAKKMTDSTSDETLQFRLSRELSIYIAYQRFLGHLASEEPKNIQFLYHLLKSMDILFVFWERDSADQISVQCPFFSDVSELLKTHEGQRKTIMFVKDGAYIDPLELKRRNLEGTPIMDSQHMTKLHTALKQCPPPFQKRDANAIRSLSYLQRWMQQMLSVPSITKLSEAVVFPDLTIRQILLRNGVAIYLPSPIPFGYAIELKEELDLKGFVYLEDIQGTIRTVRTPKVDVMFLTNKLHRSGYGFDFGQPIVSPDANIITTVLKYKFTHLPPLIPIYDEKDVSIRIHAENAKQRKWYSLQRVVGRELLKHYDTLVKPLHSKSRKDLMKVLMRTFPKIPMDKLQVVLEEMPLQYGSKVLAQWILNLGIHDAFTQRYIYNTPSQKEWVFSQNMVEQGLPSELVQPLKGPRPSFQHDKAASVIQFTESPISSPLDLPSLIQNHRIEEQELLTKFKQWNMAWAAFKRWVPKETPDYAKLRELLQWIAIQCVSTWSWEDVMFIRNKSVKAALADEGLMKSLLLDPQFFKIWAAAIKKHLKTKVATTDELWAALSKVPLIQREDIWKNIHEHNNIIPIDVDFLIMAQLMGCTFILIYRVKHGASEGTRASLEDLSVSTSVFSFSTHVTQVKRKPIFMFFRNDKESTYEPIVRSEDNKFMFKTWEELPKPMIEFMEHVLRTKRTAMM